MPHSATTHRPAALLAFACTTALVITAMLRMSSQAHAQASGRVEAPSTARPAFTVAPEAAATGFMDAEAALANFRPHVSAGRFREAVWQLQVRLARHARVPVRLRLIQRAAERLNEEHGRPLRTASLDNSAWVSALKRAAEEASTAPPASSTASLPAARTQQQTARLSVERQQSSTVHEVPFASDGNVVALELSAAGSDESDQARRVRLAEAPPAWLRFERDTVAVSSGAPAARFSFDVSEEAPARREATLVFAVEDGRSGRLLAEKAVRLEVGAPEAFALSGNYPNPFSRQTKIGYQLPEAAEVTVEVYDALGRRVQRLEEGRKEAGGHAARLRADRLASGVYFYRVRLEMEGGRQRQETGRMVLVR